MDESGTIRQGPCDACGSSDANTWYADGHQYCFSCKNYIHPDTPLRRATKISGALISGGAFKDLSKRKLTKETCQKFGYKVATYKGKTVQVAEFRDQSKAIIAQHVRTADKGFYWKGKKEQTLLFGQHLWRDKGRKLIVTEGEIDAMTVSQLQNHKWPVVSIKSGAASARKDFKDHIDWLECFDTVVIMFDNDEPGRKAAQECAMVLTPGKARIAELPLKDANDMLKAGRGEEVIQAIWEAKELRPDGIVTLPEIREQVLKPVEWGESWPWKILTHLTYGRRRGEVYTFGAGSGAGKTDIFTQIIAHILKHNNLPVAAFYMEQAVGETGKRVAGKMAGKLFHIPDAQWSKEELEHTFDTLEKGPPLYLYDSFGANDWEEIRLHIKYLAHACGVKDFFIDHLTALADPSNEKESLEHLMKDVASLAQELQITIYIVSHLTTPHGTPHEEGGRVHGNQFKGSRTIMYWSDFMFGIERNQQAEDKDERSTATFRVLKDRYTGRSNGHFFTLTYNHDTGILEETDLPDDECPFDIEEDY